MRRKLSVSAILFAVAPRSWQRGVLVLLALLFGPLLLIVLVAAADKLMRLVPEVLVVVVLLVLYRLGRRFFSRPD